MLTIYSTVLIMSKSTLNQKHCVDQDICSVLQLNVRSIPKNLKSLEKYMSNLYVCFTVVCITETS